MPQKQPSLMRIAVSVVAVGTFLGSYALKLHAKDPDDDNFVYVMSNKSPRNSVIQFQRHSDGSLSRRDEVMTGGRGTGPTGVDPLGSQDSLVLSGDGHLLLAVNAGSNELSVLEVEHNKLRLRDTVWSGGDFPNSVALSGDLVYVLNAKGSTPNISGFRLDPEGFIHAVPGARVDLPPGSTGANDIRFTNDGTKLLVTVSGTNQILVFEVGDDGVAGKPVQKASAGDSPFGIRFGRNGIAVVSEAAGSVSSYNFNATDMLNVISGAVPNTQKASCWISLNRSASYAFVSNTESGTISTYKIDGSGALTLANAFAASTGGAPIDSSLSRNSKFIYIVDSATGRIVILGVDTGNLIPIGSVSSLPTSIQGIAAQ